MLIQSQANFGFSELLRHFHQSDADRDLAEDAFMRRYKTPAETKQSPERAQGTRRLRMTRLRTRGPDALGDMRQWLDRQDCMPVSFDIVRGKRGALLANVVFKEDHIAEAFLRDFG